MRTPRIPRRPTMLACLALLVAACGRAPAEEPAPVPVPAPLVTPSPSTAPANGRVSLGDAPAYAAFAEGSITIRSQPGGRRADLLPATTPWRTPTPFLVREARRVDGDLWYRVFLPKRPNQASGWVRAEQVRTAARPYRAEVDLSARRLTVLKGDRQVRTYPVGIGRSGTPTPTGTFYVTVRLRPPQVSAVYGAWALGLSAYSEVLEQFGTGDGQIALHGTANPGDLGRQVSNGCVRLDNASISALATLLVPGSPVTIRA